MGMVKIQPLTESKPTKRLQYNFAQWITSTRRTRNPKLAPIDSKGKYVKYKANYLFLFWYIFSRLAYWSDLWADFDAQWLNTCAIMQGSAFSGSARWPATFRGSNSPKNHQNWAWICTADCLNEYWRHRRMTLALFVAALPTYFRRSLPNVC